MEREPQITNEQEITRKTEDWYSKFFRKVYAPIVITVTLGIAGLSTAAEIKRGVTGEFGENTTFAKEANIASEDALGIGFAVGGFATAGIFEWLRRGLNKAAKKQDITEVTNENITYGKPHLLYRRSC